ncbi:hypothetical protein OHC33_001468 [Knufia fluminis]|uniref:Uncharacterized protein n=1 Tax=Knufia fluminis TaxID=191047 RepID=A0AAN8EJK5_9EURO|nr:hypothetical protein OHC33_001468 [Knufia fluminis]
MAVLTDLPTEIHRQVVQEMLANLERYWASDLVHLAGISPYWRELVIDIVGKRIGELWTAAENKTIGEQERKGAPLFVAAGDYRTYRRMVKKERKAHISGSKRLRRLERVQECAARWLF